jgi:3D-(3,5/4)-trihydroxycyclohexane-1,2-dione acylhydrolase (decyclizing)
MNVQPQRMKPFNLDELLVGSPPPQGAAAEAGAYELAVEAILQAKRILIRLGGGARRASQEILELLELVDAVAIQAPVALGVVPYQHRRNMTVGGSKGSLCGNFAMEEADLVIIVGSRAVCQSDCSGTGFLKAERVININTNLEAAMHYGKTIALVGEAGATLKKLVEALKKRGVKPSSGESNWLAACKQQRRAWTEFKELRYRHPTLYDKAWGREVLTQPAAIKAALDWARANEAISFFDAGDVQANGFQIAENDRFGQTFTDGGASYMGFAASALLATALTDKACYGLAFCGDGSFTMNPQILIDGVEHGARGCILVFDNRRMAAISGLQTAQYGFDFATHDSVEVDYCAWAKAIKGVKATPACYSVEALVAALKQAKEYPGLSLIHIPVYYGPDELGGMGVFGRWNVGNWSETTQALRHQIGL